MSIVRAIDVKITAVEEEIRALESQLDDRCTTRERLQGLRQQAEFLDGEGGGLPAPASTPPPAVKTGTQTTIPTGSSAGGSRQARNAELWAEREDQVLAAIRDARDEGLSPAGIREATGLSKQQVEITIRNLEGKVSAEGTRKSRRYFTEDSTARPNPAPTPEGRAASVPARKTHARRDTEAAAAHNALRAEVKAAVLRILTEGPEAGMGADRLTATLLESVPEATSDTVRAVVVALKSKTRQIEIRANKVCLSGVDRTGPITKVEKEVVACLGSGRTAREVAANCRLVRDAFSARTILSALVSREVVVQRPDSSPPAYERREQLAEAI